MFIKGVGMTKFGISDKLSHQLAYDASLDALQDADMKFDEIDAIVVSNMEFFQSVEKQRHFASLMSSMFRTNKPIIRVPAACSGGGAAFWLANQFDFDNILVVAAEKLMTMKSEYITDEFMMGAETRYEQDDGLIFPSQNALVAQEYFLKYPETNLDHLSLIAFKNHNNAFLNPKAKFFQTKVSLEKIKSSPVVCSPLRLFDCSISVDGASAAVITKDKTDINVIGSDLQTDFLPTFEREDNTTWDATTNSARNAYSEAGMGASDVDISEIHDAFTIVELVAYEDLGFAKPGESYKKIEDGYFELDGKLPVNTSGGLKAKGHPVSATGVAQIYELVKQLRNECGDRQVNNAKIGLAQNIGGAGGTITCNIVKKVSG